MRSLKKIIINILQKFSWELFRKHKSICRRRKSCPDCYRGKIGPWGGWKGLVERGWLRWSGTQINIPGIWLQHTHGSSHSSPANGGLALNFPPAMLGSRPGTLLFTNTEGFKCISAKGALLQQKGGPFCVIWGGPPATGRHCLQQGIQSMGKSYVVHYNLSIYSCYRPTTTGT